MGRAAAWCPGVVAFPLLGLYVCEGHSSPAGQYMQGLFCVLCLAVSFASFVIQPFKTLPRLESKNLS